MLKESKPDFVFLYFGEICEMLLLVPRRSRLQRRRIKTYGLKHGVHKEDYMRTWSCLKGSAREDQFSSNERVILERCKSRWEKGAVREIIAKHTSAVSCHDRGNDRQRRLHRLVWPIALNCTDDDEAAWFSVMDPRSRVAGKTRVNRETSRRLPLHSLARTIEAFARNIATASRVAYRRKVQPRGPYR